MVMRYRVTHITEYRYGEDVTLGYNEARLKPLELEHQRCLSAGIRITPVQSEMSEDLDYFGNRVTRFSLERPHRVFRVTAISEVVVNTPRLPETMTVPPWEQVRDQIAQVAGEDVMLVDYVLDSPMVKCDAVLRDYALLSFTPGRPLLEACLDLMQRIFHEFEYDSEFTTIATPLEDVMSHRRGVCQDFAHVAIGCLRAIGLPARYVSGYLETLPPEGQERLVGADASHAWFSVGMPGFGWLDFDPTNNLMPGERHITIAYGRDYSDVAPLKGVLYGGGEHSLSVSVDVAPLEVS